MHGRKMPDSASLSFTTYLKAEWKYNHDLGIVVVVLSASLHQLQSYIRNAIFDFRPGIASYIMLYNIINWFSRVAM